MDIEQHSSINQSQIYSDLIEKKCNGGFSHIFCLNSTKGLKLTNFSAKHREVKIIECLKKRNKGILHENIINYENGMPLLEKIQSLKYYTQPLFDHIIVYPWQDCCLKYFIEKHVYMGGCL